MSAVPFVVIMLLLCVALWRDLSKDPLVIRRDLAQHLLDESVAKGVDEHGGEPFTLSTVEIQIIDAETAAAAKASQAPPERRLETKPATASGTGHTAERRDAPATDGEGPPTTR